MLQFLKDLVKTNDNRKGANNDGWSDLMAYYPKKPFHEINAGQQPDPLYMPGLDAGIPTSG